MKVSTEQLRLPVDDEPVEDVTAALHVPSRAEGAAFFLTHGAGGDLDDAGLTALADAVAEKGHLVVRANLPYREAGRKSPPRATSASRGLRKLLDAAKAQLDPTGTWVAGGKSFGGRAASLAAADGMEVSGLLFYGYPLHPPGKPDKLRVEHWPNVMVPCLFLQGTRDAFCEDGLLDANLRKLPRRATVHVVDGGDHSLRIAKKASSDGRVHPAEEITGGLGGVVDEWASSLD